MTKKKTAKAFDFHVDSKNAHAVLERLAESLDASCFTLHFNDYGNPKIHAGILSRYGKAACELALHFVETKRKVIAPERRIALCKLGAVYGKSPAQFKPNCIMTVESFARSLGMLDQLPEIEAMLCRELLDTMSSHLDEDPMWRIWNGASWIEIDPWRFVVEMDLGIKIEEAEQ